MNMQNILERYADLVVNYSVSIKKGERVYIQATTVAEPLVKEIYKAVIKAGGLPHVKLEMQDEQAILLNEANEEQLNYVDPVYALAMKEFEAYIYVRAPFGEASAFAYHKSNAAIRTAALAPHRKNYTNRTATLELKRTLCEYPTEKHAENAGMSLEAYANFIFDACGLNEESPVAYWNSVHDFQQGIVEYLNKCQTIRYVNKKSDISFSTKERIWMNSDGQTNMPSGEVYTCPVEDSVNGYIHFDYPSVFQGEDVKGITLWVKNGWIERWEAEQGEALLERVFNTDEGARRFGEAAIGTNMRIQTPVRNILFDEKIGGTIHMAVGQSYIQTGGKNQSTIHWDMIAGMQDGGQIFADGTLIYENGKFLI